MRKLVVSIVALVMAASVGPAVSARPAVAVQREGFAFASWITPTRERNTFEWHGAMVISENEATGDGSLIGGVIRGKCRRKGESMSCSGKGPGIDRGDTFEMDPAAGSASLKMKAAGVIHTVEWTANNDAEGLRNSGFYEAGEGCEDGQGVGAGIYRAAKTTGRVFGRRFSSRPGNKWEFFNMLMAGAMVTQCGYGLGVEDIRALSNGERVRVDIPVR